MKRRIAGAMLEGWYRSDPLDRKLLARLVAVVIALGATHSVFAAMILFSVLDWLVE